jgi:hypothetical protein
LERIAAYTDQAIVRRTNCPGPYEGRSAVDAGAAALIASPLFAQAARRYEWHVTAAAAPRCLLRRRGSAQNAQYCG